MEPSADWIFPRKFPFDFIRVASTGDLFFTTNLVRKMNISFIVFLHLYLKSNPHAFEIKPSEIFLYTQYVCEDPDSHRLIQNVLAWCILYFTVNN